MTSSISSESRAQLTRVARGGALNLVGAAIAALSGFGLVAVIARSFDASTAGVLFATTSAFLVVVALAVFGADTGVVHFLGRLEETERSADIPTMLRCARRPVLAVSVAVAGATIVLAQPVADAMRLDHPQAPTVLRTLALCVPLTALAQLALSETRAIGLMRPTVLIDNIARSSAQLVGAVAVGALGAGLLALTYSWVLPYALSAAAAIPVARFYLRRRSARWTTTGRSDVAAVRREFNRYSWPRGVARLSQIVIQRADVIVVAAVLGTAPAAVYTAATRFVVVGQMAGQAISNVLMPRLAQLLARRDLDTVSEVFKVSTAWSMAITWPLYGVIASCAGPYLRIFGEGYVGRDGVPVVIIMCVAMMMAVAAGALDTVLLMSGRSVASLVNGVVAAVVNVGLCLVLIPWVGMVGAAIAWAAAVVVRNGLAYGQVRQDLGVTPWSAGAALVAVSVACCYVAPLATLTVTDVLTPATGLVAGIVGTVLYAAFLWWGRTLLALDVLLSVLPRRVRHRLDGP